MNLKTSVCAVVMKTVGGERFVNMFLPVITSSPVLPGGLWSFQILGTRDQLSSVAYE